MNYSHFIVILETMQMFANHLYYVGTFRGTLQRHESFLVTQQDEPENPLLLRTGFELSRCGVSSTWRLPTSDSRT